MSLPTLKEFVDHVKDKFNIEEKLTTNTFFGPRGPVRPRYLERRLPPAGRINVVLPEIPEDAPLTLPQLSQLCRRLKIPLTEFGFFKN